MERRVFTYKDVEEARKYIGKRGLFTQDYQEAMEGLNGNGIGSVVSTLDHVNDSGFVFVPDESDWVGASNYQFFVPDPEPVEKWVPFTADDWALFVGKPITRWNNGWFLTIQGFSSEEVDIRSSGTHTYKELLEVWKFIDGTPCGKRVVG